MGRRSRSAGAFLMRAAPPVAMARRPLAAALIAAATAACAQQPQAGEPQAAASGCSQPIIVAFVAAPSEALFSELERTSGSRFEARTALTPTLYALTVGADSSQMACAAAVEQLRRDARVRSVDFDERRSPHSPGAGRSEG